MILAIGIALLVIVLASVIVPAIHCFREDRKIREARNREAARQAAINTLPAGWLWKPVATVPKGHYYCAMCGEPEAPKPRTLCPACVSYWGMEEGERECVLRDYELQMEEAQQ